MGARKTGTDADAGAAAAGGETAVVEILASWSASVHPRYADLLECLAGAGVEPKEGPEEARTVLRALHERARAFVTAAVAEEVKQALDALATGAASKSPSFHSDLERLVTRANAEIARHVDQTRAALVNDLRSWAALIDPDETARVLQTLFKNEGSENTGPLLAAALDLRRAQEILASARRGLIDAVERDLSASAEAATDAEAVRRARAALETGRPDDAAHARVLAGRLRVEAERRSSEGRLAAARASLGALCETGKKSRRQGPADSVLDALVAESIEHAEAALREDPAATRREEVAALGSVLASRERTLAALLDEAPGRSDERRAWDARIDAIVEEIAKRASRGGDPALSAAVEALRATVSVRDGRFHETLLDALGTLRQLEERESREFSSAAQGLRLREGQLASLLERAARELPTASIVEARSFLDRVEAVLASGRVEEVAALDRDLAERVERLEHLASLVDRRQKGREQSRREALHDEAMALAEVATGRAARRLRTLVAETKRADPNQLDRLREQLERVGGVVGRRVRLDAGRALYAAERRLRGGKTTRARPEDLRALAEGVRSALTADDLSAARRSGAELRARLRAESLFSRPAIRIVLATLPVAMLVAVVFMLRARPTTYTFRLDPVPQGRVRVALLHDGEFLPVDFAGPEAGSAELRPGRYEIFVNDRFTGRVVLVPQDARDVLAIPFPPD